MRVLLVTRRYWPAVGGIERVALTLGAGLRAAGHDVSVAAQRIDEGAHTAMMHILREAPEFEPFEHDGVRVRQVRLPRARRALLAPFAVEHVPLLARLSRGVVRKWTARWYAAAARPALAPLVAGADVVHVLGGDLLAYAAVDAAHRAGRAAVVSPFAHPGAWGMDAASVRAYREAEFVLATLEADAGPYRGAGVPPDRVLVAGLPVPAVAAPARSAGWSPEPETPLVLFLGARRHTKGIDLLLDAARELWAVRPDVRFAVVGPGDSLPWSDPRLVDVGEVTDTERAEWLDRATVLCLPSESESFGLVVAEAGSAAVPVVVSDIPVLRELIAAGGGGLVAQRTARAMAHALDAVVADPAAARRMGEAGHAHWRERYQPAAVTARYLEIYDEARRRR